MQTLRPEIQSQPEIQDCSTPVHKVNNFHHLWGRVSEEEAATEAADIQTPEETTTTQVIHVATVEIHNTNTGQNAKPSKLNVIFATD